MAAILPVSSRMGAYLAILLHPAGSIPVINSQSDINNPASAVVPVNSDSCC